MNKFKFPPKRPLDHLQAVSSICRAMSEIIVSSTTETLNLSKTGRDGLAALFGMLDEELVYIHESVADKLEK